MIIDSRVRLVVPSDEPQPIRLAAQDLASDFKKVLAIAPKIETSGNAANGETILIGEAAKLPGSMRPAGVTAPESFSIGVVRSGAAAPILVLSGADMRGTIYAIYQFSQQFLGVDPMYYWTDHQPLRRSRILIRADFHQTFPPPVFRYRGFFINDEDLLTGWAPGTRDHTGISLAVWNKVFETVLRLKGNMIVPGTWIFPDDPQIKLAGERGLIVTQHHAIPLGVNVARWPGGVPYNFSTHPEILERAWKDAVAEYPPHQHILWDVGLRGLSDVSYASMDPSVRGNDKRLGMLISKAIRDQMAIVRAVHPNARFVTDLWQEGARLQKEGYLSIPPEVTTVWADDGWGNLQDGGMVRAGEGMYYHVAMLNGHTNQLSEMVPVQRIAREFARYIKAGATQYMLVNTSSIRPFAMETEAVMNMAWKGRLPGAQQSPYGFYRHWAAEEFGEKAAPAIAAVYKAYFAAPARFPGNEPREYGDEHYHMEGRQMLTTYMIDSPLYAIPSQSPKWEIPRLVGREYGGRFGGKEWLKETVQREIRQCSQAQPRWDKVWIMALAAKHLVPANRQLYYQGGVLTMVAINRESNRMLWMIAQSIADAQAGKTAQAESEAAQALDAADQVRHAETAAEYGKWKNWYRGDWLTDAYRSQQMLRIYAKVLKEPLAPLPPPILWGGWEAYYHIMHYEGNRTADVQ